ncbi:protein Wnt-11b-2-like isoform X1 [Galleria mellonella]|uniref:Protein Wnt n=2 Tax=Galleria mellonella TaxID=7137 RepID=A0A6J1X4E6_GALME|nr:protein Wnt-11b-2-like isoform X1 [Galleria mellonella]
MRGYIVFLSVCFFIFLPQSTEAIRWLALHEKEGNWTESDCGEARRSGALWGGQSRVCRRQVSAMPHVAAAARLARAACLNAHAGDRWNCSSIELAPKFTPDLLTGTREQAYVYAMSAAALAWSVARACAAGALPACSCAAPPRAPPRPPRQAQVTPAEPHARFKWGGCGDNFQWAQRFAKQFLDAHEIDVRDGRIEDFFEEETTTTELSTTVTMEPTTVPPVVILVDDQPAPTNTTSRPKTGKKGRRGRKRLPRSPRRGRPTRKRFRSRYEYEDRGSRYRNIEYRMAADDPRFDPQVDLRTRLERLRPLIASANLLNYRFGRNVVSSGMRTKCTCHGVSGSCSVRTCWRALPPLARAAAALAAEAARAGPLRPRRRAARRARPRLRYVTPSPDYCEPDPAAGSLGTHGRKCNASVGSGRGGCGRLCCGRGRRAVRSSRLERCHCRYHWCCRVDCQLCRLTTEEHYCN